MNVVLMMIARLMSSGGSVSGPAGAERVQRRKGGQVCMENDRENDLEEEKVAPITHMTLTVFPPLQRMAVLASALRVISTPSSRPNGRRINETYEIAARTEYIPAKLLGFTMHDAF